MLIINNSLIVNPGKSRRLVVERLDCALDFLTLHFFWLSKPCLLQLNPFWGLFSKFEARIQVVPRKKSADDL